MNAKEQKIYDEMKEMAATRFDEFVQLVGIDPTKFIVCSKKKKGQSVRQIAINTNLSKSKVDRLCKVCP